MSERKDKDLTKVLGNYLDEHPEIANRTVKKTDEMSDQAILAKIGGKKCSVYGCKEVFDKSYKGKMYTHVERCGNDEAEFFGVYEVQDDGTEEWLGDFSTWEDASLFEKEKEKTR
jgi:hypothetical protein